MPLTTDLGNEPTSKYPYDEANQDVLESSSGLEPPIPDDENETVGPPSEWLLHSQSPLLYLIIIFFMFVIIFFVFNPSLSPQDGGNTDKLVPVRLLK